MGDKMGMKAGTVNCQRQAATFRDVSGSSYGCSGVSKTSKSGSKKKKRLYYNFKEISGMILKAKKSVNAGQVVVSARSRVAVLRRKMGTGDYNETELAAAIIHAEKMVRIAKKKLKNLREEERAARGQIASDQKQMEEESRDMDLSGMEGLFSDSSEVDKEELRKLIQEMERQMQELMEEAESMEELSDAFFGGGDMSPEELEAWKKKHRTEEMRDIVDADMKYLKAMFEHFCREQQEAASGVILQLGSAMTAAQAPVSIAVHVEGGSVDVAL